MTFDTRASMPPLKVLNYLENEIEKNLSTSRIQEWFCSTSGHKLNFFLALSHIRIIKYILENCFNYDEAQEYNFFYNNAGDFYPSLVLADMESAIHGMSGQLGQELKSNKRLVLELIGSKVDATLVILLGLFSILIGSYVLLNKREDTVSEYNDGELDVPTEALFKYMKNENILKMSVSGALFLADLVIYGIKKMGEYFQILKEKKELLKDFNTTDQALTENIKKLFINMSILDGVEGIDTEHRVNEAYHEFTLMSGIFQTSLACIEKIHAIGLEFNEAEEITEWIFKNMEPFSNNSDWCKKTTNCISELFLVIYQDKFDKKTMKKIDVCFDLLTQLSMSNNPNRNRTAAYLNNMHAMLERLTDNQKNRWRLTNCANKAVTCSSGAAIQIFNSGLHYGAIGCQYGGRALFFARTSAYNIGRGAYNLCKDISIFSDDEQNELDNAEHLDI